MNRTREVCPEKHLHEPTIDRSAHMTKKAEMLPCPFCGSPGKMIATMGEWVGPPDNYGPDGARVVCSNSHCSGMAMPFHGQDKNQKATVAWNTRPSPDAGLVERGAVDRIVTRAIDRQWDAAIYGESRSALQRAAVTKNAVDDILALLSTRAVAGEPVDKPRNLETFDLGFKAGYRLGVADTEDPAPSGRDPATIEACAKTAQAVMITSHDPYNCREEIVDSIRALAAPAVVTEER